MIHARNTFALRAALLASCAALAVGSAAHAQTAEGQKSEAETVEAVVVTGFRQAYANAIATKRETLEISDGISSDGLGRFPDLNVGEAIQRIPGVQINREAGSRNATISLRGLPGSFARTTLNGGAFADPILNGSTPLGAFNSDIFTAINVIKTPSASNLAGGLSGNVDLRINPALSRKDGGFAKLSYEYNDLGSLGSPLASLGYNKHLTDDFAVFGVVAWKDEKFRRDSITVNSWGNRLGAIQLGNQAAAGSNPVYDALLAQYPGGVYYPSQTRQLVKFNRGTTLSASTGFEYRINESWKFGANAFMTKRKLDEATNHLLYIDAGAGNGTNTGLGATSAVAKISEIGTPFIVKTPNGDRAYINSFKAENINTFDSVRSEPAENSTWAINPTLEFKNDDWKATATLTVSRAKAYANQIEFDVVQNPYRNLGPAGLNGIVALVNLGGSDLSNYSANLTTPKPTHLPNGGFPIPATATATTQAGAPMPGQSATTAADRFGVTGTNGKADNTLDAFQVDFERTLDGFFTVLQFGGRAETAKFTSSGSRNTALGAQTQNITPDMASQLSYANDFFGGKAPGATANWMTVDVQRVLTALTPLNTNLRTALNPNGLPDQFQLGAPGVFLTPYGFVNNYTDGNYWNNNFSNQNDVYSAYVAAKFKGDLFSIPFRGTLGTRYERTQQEIVALNCKNCTTALSGQAGPINHSLSTSTRKNEYDYWLPSAIFMADLRDDLVFRAAAYRTYVRPQPRDNVPTTFVQVPVDVNPPTDPVYTVTLGATDIKPYTADSFDASLEWYNRPGGLVSLAAYRKEIKGFIGPITDPSVLCPASGKIDGIDVDLGTLTIDTSAGSPKCVSSNRFVGSGGILKNAEVRVSGRTNQSPMTVTGLEFNIQQNLDFLPGFWKNFGGAFNYSYTKIDGVDTAGKKITLPSVSKNNLNVIGYYEAGWGGVRLVYNWRDKYDLAAGNSFVGDARTVKARSQLDASASYKLTESMTVSVDAFNLTNAQRAEYENDPMLPRFIDYDGRTYQLTLRATF
ncbi:MULTISPECIES: TonB-dependent receptor [unclassified Caulobacter]|uniref:TonB-dependent receptor n=1 Tax=unclassified Caulobacter TaxID=2648921 RepID=UPI000784C090|nr:MULTISPECIES: TonB-dependent receptor [unclassified Caulobacter]AZS20638.1 TonB-dependent receptor [Caulobacter sp. FWC26]